MSFLFTPFPAFQMQAQPISDSAASCICHGRLLHELSKPSVPGRYTPHTLSPERLRMRIRILFHSSINKRDKEGRNNHEDPEP